MRGRPILRLFMSAAGRRIAASLQDHPFQWIGSKERTRPCPPTIEGRLEHCQGLTLIYSHTIMPRSCPCIDTSPAALNWADKCAILPLAEALLFAGEREGREAVIEKAMDL